ncbi:hypothetical protein NKDENANG_01678 [Candidatus Entotheonellaceae bacterium PAL068K]
MARGPLFQDTYNPQFSGHETFPLRYGWLKKAFDRVAETENQPDNRAACWDDDAIARFGVGKNMVASMRHWAKAARVIEEPAISSVRPTELGRLIFGPKGLDPYMEYPATLWLVHWQLAAHEDKTTWFWAFSYYPAITFERDALVKRLDRLAKDRKWSRVANTTIKNDVACFIRTYAARQPSSKTGHDDVLESPLTELGLIKAIGKKDGFRFVRGPKTTLGDGVFTCALIDFWSRYAPNAATLSFEAIAHAPGGPGRVFQFDENDVADRLAALDDITGGALRWSETAGLKQVVRNVDIDGDAKFRWRWLRMDYDGAHRGEAA